jgi:hypothetical protein
MAKKAKQVMTTDCLQHASPHSEHAHYELRTHTHTRDFCDCVRVSVSGWLRVEYGTL